MAKYKVYGQQNMVVWEDIVKADSEQEAIDKLQGSTLDHDQFEMDSLPTVVEVQS